MKKEMDKTEGAEMTYLVSEVKPVEASRPGAMAGYEWKCSCGMSGRNSIRSNSEMDAAAHAAYHERKAQRAAA